MSSPILPPNFEGFATRLAAEIEDVEGFLSPREVRFLALLGSVPTAPGVVLEIGSFKGKSTVILAKSSALAGEDQIFAVDPMEPSPPMEASPAMEAPPAMEASPAAVDPPARPSSLSDFEHNLRAKGVRHRVDFARCFSHELAQTWDRPLRLLWIDGDHTYEGAKTDFDGFTPHLADGAIIALHDVLHACEGGVRVYMEDVLLSPHFGPCGLVGSIGWAQYRADKATTHGHRASKLRLYKGLSRLVPHVALGGRPEGARKHLYKYLRSRIPHGAVDPDEWVENVSLP